jgi:hypothetical protein
VLERLGVTRGGNLHELNQKLRSRILPLEENGSDALYFKPQLLGEFALGSCKMVLTRGQLAARELPKPAMALVRRALGKQHTTVSPNDCGKDPN